MMKYLFTYSLLFFAYVHILGQSLAQDIHPRDYVESVSVVCDRDYYVVNETIHFRAFNLSSTQLRELEWSKVLYVELISSEGKAIAQSKLDYSSRGGHGQFKVPEGILSGVYYIKAYTKWMRNYGPEFYFYKPICLLNPSQSLVYLPEDNRPADFSISYSRMSDRNEGRITADKSKYSTREPGKIYFLNATEQQNDFSLSISKRSYFNDSLISLNPIDTSIRFSNKYLPETRGITLTGLLLDKSTQDPISNRSVTVTIKKGKRVTYLSYTNSSGIFNVVIPECYGNAELLFLAEELRGEELEIKLESDFCVRNVCLPYIPLQIGSKAIDRYNELIVDSKIEALYHPSAIRGDSTKLSELFLYEDPSLSLEVDQFIRMSSIRELFKELVPAVGFRQENNKTIMHISGPYYYRLDTYEPLVLLDGLIVKDIDKLLLISPSDLKSVETLNVPYVIGDITYGGVVKIESKEGDFASYELPSSGLIYNFMFLSIAANSYELPSNSSWRDAMFSNTLYWDSGFNESGERQEHQFRTSDNAGEYSVIVYELMDNGELGYSRADFIVE